MPSPCDLRSISGDQFSEEAKDEPTYTILQFSDVTQYYLPHLSEQEHRSRACS